jgi:hypothetical protein
MSVPTYPAAGWRLNRLALAVALIGMLAALWLGVVLWQQNQITPITTPIGSASAVDTQTGVERPLGVNQRYRPNTRFVQRNTATMPPPGQPFAD